MSHEETAGEAIKVNCQDLGMDHFKLETCGPNVTAQKVAILPDEFSVAPVIMKRC